MNGTNSSEKDQAFANYRAAATTFSATIAGVVVGGLALFQAHGEDALANRWIIALAIVLVLGVTTIQFLMFRGYYFFAKHMLDTYGEDRQGLNWAESNKSFGDADQLAENVFRIFAILLLVLLCFVLFR